MDSPQRGGLLPQTNNFSTIERLLLIHNFVAEFLDHRVRQDLAGHALDLLFGGLARYAIQVQHEKLALPDLAHVAESQRRQRVLYRLTLRIEYGAFRHDPHVSFHGGIIASPAPQHRSEMFPASRAFLREAETNIRSWPRRA